MICPLCGSKVVYQGLTSLECSAENNPDCENKSKSYKLPETECEWNKIFAEFGNPWGLFFKWDDTKTIVALPWVRYVDVERTRFRVPPSKTRVSLPIDVSWVKQNVGRECYDQMLNELRLRGIVE